LRISSRGDYGIRALLVLAEKYGDEPVQSHEIAAEAGIPEAYLNQLLISLRRAGLIRSLRGPQGGHGLARHPSQITIAEAVEALEGPLAPVDCLNGNDKQRCSLSYACVLQPVWTKVQEATQSILSSVTMEDLVHEQAKRRCLIDYQI
jgi:Rrf2 family transcriptional regulator, cysteine metabolism repressor